MASNGKTTTIEPPDSLVAQRADIVAVIAAAGEADLGRVEARIAEIERELSSLRMVKGILDRRLGRTQPPGPKQAPSKPGRNTTHDHRVQVAKYLLHSGVAVRPAIVAKDCDIPMGSITNVLEHPWFAKDVNGIKLSAEGRQAAGSV